MKISNYPQGSIEWLHDRLGVLTGSKIKQAVGVKLKPTKKGMETLAYKLAFERLTGISTESDYTSPAMERGNEIEPIARELFSETYGIKIKEFGLCKSEKFRWLGCSPDGLTEDFKIGIEIKCFVNVNYLKAIDPENKFSIFSEHKPQCLDYFIVNEKLETLYLVAYCPEFYIYPMHVEKITREQVKNEIDTLENSAEIILDEVENIIARITPEF